LFRYLVFSGLLSLAFYAGRRSVEWQPASAPAFTASTQLSAGPADVAMAHRACSDNCEQQAILLNANDLHLRACKAHCDADFPLPVNVRETPSRISVAPADHHR
jgi:hypothetical protein